MGRGALTGRSRAIAFACALALASAALSPATAPAGGTPEPVLNSISTSAGAPGDVVTLSGSGFGETASETSYVTFSGMRAKTTTWSDTAITVLVPERCVPGYVGVTVDNVTTNGKWFSPNARPRVTSLSRQSAVAGTSITITGTGFGRTQRAGWVTFGGRAAPIVSWSDTRVVVIVPKLAEQLCWVGVWQNGAPSNGMLFMPFLAPHIDSLSTQRVKAGQTLTLRGKRFGSRNDPGAIVRIGGMEVVPTIWTDSTITLTVPNDAPTGYVGVWRRGASSNGSFVYVAPQIESISQWWVEPGETLTIDGGGFGSATRVTIGGVEVPILGQSESRITVLVTESAREGYVGVWNGGAASNGIWVLPIQRPRIESLSATVLPSGGWFAIDGSGFGDTQGTTRVMLGELACYTQSWSDTRIVAQVPYSWTENDGWSAAPSGYVGVWKRGLASNGAWLTVSGRD